MTSSIYLCWIFDPELVKARHSWIKCCNTSKQNKCVALSKEKCIIKYYVLYIKATIESILHITSRWYVADAALLHTLRIHSDDQGAFGRASLASSTFNKEQPSTTYEESHSTTSKPLKPKNISSPPHNEKYHVSIKHICAKFLQRVKFFWSLVIYGFPLWNF